MINKIEGLTMTDEQMNSFIHAIGRGELYEEIKDCNDMSVNWRGSRYPHYLKAVRVSLIEMGFDSLWVEGKFREALEAKYLEK